MQDDTPNKNLAPKTRRQVMQAASSVVGIVALRGFEVASAQASSDNAIFTHGVASGDPLADRVILWTRVIPADGKAQKLSIDWQVSTSPDFDQLASSGSASSGPKSDYTVKVDAAGLAADTAYYYRFICQGVSSAIGKTKTLPKTGTQGIKLAVVSCSNYPQGYFHVYKEVASRDYAAVLHLGDYIYEYPAGTYSNDEMTQSHGRQVTPKGEVVALEDYRTRYGLYRSDPDLQAAHAAHPFICIWDDHEVANDTWRTGAENHNEGEGEFEARKQAALQAYHEWLPIRDNIRNDQTKIYRSFEIGDLATLIMLDTRLIGRDKPLNYSHDLPLRTIPFRFVPDATPVAITDADQFKRLKAAPETKAQLKEIPIPFTLADGKADPILDWTEIQKIDPENMPKGVSYLPDLAHFKDSILPDDARNMLGETQQLWLTRQLARSNRQGKPWQIIGQQVLTGKVGIPSIKDEDIDTNRKSYVSPRRIAEFRMLAALGLPLNLDAWDGYPIARETLFKAIKAKGSNAVLLAGDTHNAWAFDLKDEQGDSVAVEFATAGVSSPGMEEYLPVASDVLSAALHKSSPELVAFDGEHRGWLELNLTATEVTATFQFVSTVHHQAYQLLEPVSRAVKLGDHKISDAQ